MATQKDSEPFLMKNGLGKEAAERIAQTLTAIDPGFRRKEFIRQVVAGIEPLELKERLHHFIDILSRFLPADFNEAAEILAQVPPHWLRGKPGNTLHSFAAWPLIDYIPRHGMEMPERSLDLLHDLTKLFSAEFAIRPFLKGHFTATHQRMLVWCDDPDHHVRRLASEGARPRLPWGERLPQFIADPTPVLEILERLKDDPSEYVRRSVANNLNDISKDHPELVIATCRRWLEEGGENRDRIVRHALRTLVKSGRAEVFPLLGFTEQPRLALQSFSLHTPTIRLGEKLSIAFTLESQSKSAQRLVLDYGIHFMKASGVQNLKVFKLKTVTLNSGERMRIEKKHTIKPITTRRYYPGEHKVELFVNGKPYAEGTFMLKIEE